ncbi:MAG TPA: CvpA family protein [Candidatus Dormibacteraeota bacterium]|nr:CvpA family protein [Candidatus Dormibacteraeota bacterium]
MNVLIDVLGVALVVLNVALGLRYGLVRRLVAVAGLYLGILFAAFAGNSVARWAYGSGKARSLYADSWSFLIIVTIVVVGLEILGMLYHEKLNAVVSLVLDRSTAAVVGACLGIMEIALVCLVGLGTGTAQEANPLSPLPPDRASISDSVRSSVIGGRVNGLQSQFDSLFQPVLPKDLASHLAEEATVDITKS